jgi:D-methionine transport system permease protein
MTEALQKLLDNGVLQTGIWETVYMTILSTALAYLIGLPLGVLLTVTDKDGIHPIVWLNKILGFIVNVFRSMPFIILMVAFLPVSKLLVGKSYGNEALIVMLVIAAAPYIARMVESSIKEVSAGIIEAAQSMGTSTFRIITKVLLPEALPSLLNGSAVAAITILGYSAMSGAVGGGGLGKLAIMYGYNRYQTDVMFATIILLIIIVQLFQMIGNWATKRSDKRVF